MQRAREFIAGTRTASRPAGRGAAAFLLESNPLGRAVVLRKARDMTRAKSHGHYPALDAAIDAIAAGYSMPRERAYAEEARLFGEMAMTGVSKELVFLFFATTSLKKDYGGSGDADHRVPDDVRRPSPPEVLRRRLHLVVEALGPLRGVGHLGQRPRLDCPTLSTGRPSRSASTRSAASTDTASAR